MIRGRSGETHYGENKNAISQKMVENNHLSDVLDRLDRYALFKRIEPLTINFGPRANVLNGQCCPTCPDSQVYGEGAAWSTVSRSAKDAHLVSVIEARSPT